MARMSQPKSSIYSIATLLNLEFPSIFPSEDFNCEETDVEYLFESPINQIEPDPSVFEVSGSNLAQLQKVISHFRTPIEIPDGKKKSSLTSHEQFWLSRECILRFLRGSKWRTKATIERLIATLVWRRKTLATLERYASQIYNLFESGGVIFSGYDHCNRPVIQINLNRFQISNESSEVFLAAAVFYLENVLQYMPRGQEEVTVLLDFNDPYHNVPIDSGKVMTASSILRRLFNTFDRHYPERLGRVYVNHVPWYGWTFINYLKLRDSALRKKIAVKEHAYDNVPLSQLHENWGGTLTYIYNHYLYWSKFVKLAGVRRRQMYERFVQLGGTPGISEFDQMSEGVSLFPVYVPTSDEMAAKKNATQPESGRSSESVTVSEGNTQTEKHREDPDSSGLWTPTFLREVRADIVQQQKSASTSELKRAQTLKTGLISSKTSCDTYVTRNKSLYVCRKESFDATISDITTVIHRESIDAVSTDGPELEEVRRLRREAEEKMRAIEGRFEKFREDRSELSEDRSFERRDEQKWEEKRGDQRWEEKKKEKKRDEESRSQELKELDKIKPSEDIISDPAEIRRTKSSGSKPLPKTRIEKLKSEIARQAQLSKAERTEKSIYGESKRYSSHEISKSVQAMAAKLQAEISPNWNNFKREEDNESVYSSEDVASFKSMKQELFTTKSDSGTSYVSYVPGFSEPGSPKSVDTEHLIGSSPLTEEPIYYKKPKMKVS